jgi:hypothetical protein
MKSLPEVREEHLRAAKAAAEGKEVPSGIAASRAFKALVQAMQKK